MSGRKHFFLAPALTTPLYVCGGLQIFLRAAELAGRLRAVEVLTYRHREDGVRHLDDVDPDELDEGVVWVTWQSHVIELARRLAGRPRVVLYAQNADYGREFGQVTPAAWPIVCLSRFILAEYSVLQPWRQLLLLPPALHPAARDDGRAKRDVDVLVHRRKNVPYVVDELAPALAGRLHVETLDRWMPQEEFLGWLRRSRVYLYWMHRNVVGLFEGFGMQPLEAIACGATPVANAYGGLGDYLEPPHNALKVGVHSLAYDVAQIEAAVRRHDGTNGDAARVREHYGEDAFLRRFLRIEEELEHYFQHRPESPPTSFALAPSPPPPWRRPYVALYRRYHRWRRRLLGILPD